MLQHVWRNKNANTGKKKSRLKTALFKIILMVNYFLFKKSSTKSGAITASTKV